MPDATRRTRLSGLLAATAVLGACAPELWVRKPPPRPWTYIAAPARERTPLLDATLSVTPLADAREKTNTYRSWFMLVPLVPSATSVYGDPSALARSVGTPYTAQEPWTVSFTDVVPQAIADEIGRARIFRTVATEAVPSGEYVLSGELLATTVRRTGSCYGLSVFGTLVWLLGTPALWIEDELGVRLVLTRRGTEAPLWTHELRGHASARYGAHDMTAGRVREFLFESALADAMPAMLAALEEAVRGLAEPAPRWSGGTDHE